MCERVANAVSLRMQTTSGSAVGVPLTVPVHRMVRAFLTVR